MKKKLSLIIFIICMCLSFTACEEEKEYKPLQDSNLAEEQTVDEEVAQGKYDMSVLDIVYDSKKIPDSFWKKQAGVDSSKTYEKLYKEKIEENLGCIFGHLSVLTPKYSNFIKLGELTYEIEINKEGWLYANDIRCMSINNDITTMTFYALRTDMEMEPVILELKDGSFYNNEYISKDWSSKKINKWAIYDAEDTYDMFYKVNDEYYLKIQIDKIKDLDDKKNEIFCKKLAMNFSLNEMIRKEGTEHISIENEQLKYRISNDLLFDFENCTINEWFVEEDVMDICNVIHFSVNGQSCKYTIQEYKDIKTAKEYMEKYGEHYTYEEADYNGVPIYIERGLQGEGESPSEISAVIFDMKNTLYVVYKSNLVENVLLTDKDDYIKDMTFLKLGK